MANAWPTSQDFNEAIQNPASAFLDGMLRASEAILSPLGLPIPRSGNFADVYEFRSTDGRKWAIKCFTRKVANLQARYAAIDNHLRKAALPFAVPFRYLDQGIRVRGQAYPLVVMEWVEGFTLNEFVRDQLDRKPTLHSLLQIWTKLVPRLREASLAHADLQHGNVLLVPGATTDRLGLKLIDYDGMWVPSLSKQASGEVGHPNYQHPMRTRERIYSLEVDRFPHLAIATALRASLVFGREIWDRYDNGDNLLFKEKDFQNPAQSELFKELWQGGDGTLSALTGTLVLSLQDSIDGTPWLDHVLDRRTGAKLGSQKESQVDAILGVRRTALAIAPPPVVEDEFNVFAHLDEPSAPPPPMPGPKPTHIKKKQNPALIPAVALLLFLMMVGIVVAVLQMQRKEGDSDLQAVVVPKEVGTERKTEIEPPPIVEKKTLEEPRVEVKNETPKPKPKVIVEPDVPRLVGLSPKVATASYRGQVLRAIGFGPKDQSVIVVTGDAIEQVDHVNLRLIKKHPIEKIAHATILPDGAIVYFDSASASMKVATLTEDLKTESFEPAGQKMDAMEVLIASANGQVVISQHIDREVRRWDRKTMQSKSLFRLASDKDRIGSVIENSSGELLLVGTTSDREVWLRSVDRPEEEIKLPGQLQYAKFHQPKDRNFLVALQPDEGKFLGWNLSTKERILDESNAKGKARIVRGPGQSLIVQGIERGGEWIEKDPRQRTRMLFPELDDLSTLAWDSSQNLAIGLNSAKDLQIWSKVWRERIIEAKKLEQLPDKTDGMMLELPGTKVTGKVKDLLVSPDRSLATLWMESGDLNTISLQSLGRRGSAISSIPDIQSIASVGNRLIVAGAKGELLTQDRNGTLTTDGPSRDSSSSITTRIVPVRDPARVITRERGKSLISIWPLEAMSEPNLVEVPMPAMIGKGLWASQDGSRFLVENGKQIHLYDFAELKEPVETLSGVPDRMSEMALSPEGSRILGLAENGNLYLWDEARKPPKLLIRGIPRPCLDLGWLANRRHAILIQSEQAIVVDTLLVEPSIRIPFSAPILFGKLTHRENRLVTLDQAESLLSVKSITIGEGIPTRTNPAMVGVVSSPRIEGRIQDLFCSASGKVWLSFGGKKDFKDHLLSIDAVTLKIHREVEVPGADSPTFEALHDPKLIGLYNQDRVLAIWNPESDEAPKLITGESLKIKGGDTFDLISIPGPGSKVYLIRIGGTIQRYDLEKKTGQEFSRFKPIDARAKVRVTPSGKSFLVNTSPNKLEFFDIKTGAGVTTSPRSINVDNGQIQDFHFVGDEKQLVLVVHSRESIKGNRDNKDFIRGWSIFPTTSSKPNFEFNVPNLEELIPIPNSLSFITRQANQPELLLWDAKRKEGRVGSLKLPANVQLVRTSSEKDRIYAVDRDGIVYRIDITQAFSSP
jgi:WD40 repeat protein